MGVLDTVKTRLHRLRRDVPRLDHVVRAYGRYGDAGGGRLASTVVLPAFLAFFPLLALAFFVLATVLSGSVSAQRSVLDAVHGYLPGLLCTSAKGIAAYPCTGATIDISTISPKSSAGVLSAIIGVVGLALTGTGWVDALRAAVRGVWHQKVDGGGNIVVKKLKDLVILATLGGALLASLVVSGLATSATSAVLSGLGMTGGGIANVILKVVGVGISIAVNLAVFLFLFTRLTDSASPLRRVLRGSLLAAVLLAVLQIVGATYIKHTTGNPVYGSFAVIIGLILWISLVTQVTLFSAAWTVTAPFLDDQAPSGSMEIAPPELPQGPGLGPLAPLTGVPASRVEAEVAAARDFGVPLPDGSAAARSAGVAGVGLLVAGAAGVAVYGIRTLRDAVR